MSVFSNNHLPQKKKRVNIKGMEEEQKKKMGGERKALTKEERISPATYSLYSFWYFTDRNNNPHAEGTVEMGTRVESLAAGTWIEKGKHYDEIALQRTIKLIPEEVFWQA